MAGARPGNDDPSGGPSGGTAGQEPHAAAPGEGGQTVNAGRDAYVAGGDQYIFTVNMPAGQPGGSDGPGLGARLFTARVPRRSGQFCVGFGAGDTLVVTEKDTTVHRWSLRDGARLPGAAASPAPRLRLMRVDVGTRMAASTAIPAVAVSRGAQVTLLHFGDGGYRAITVPLGTSEFLIAADGERFATYDGRGVAVRDFADGTVIWRAPGPRNLATAALDARGVTAAMAGGPNAFAGSNKVVVATQDDPAPRDFAFANFPLGAGCQLGVSPDGELVACASFREIVVARPRTRQIVRRKPLGSVREDVVASLGTRPHRLICSPRGDILWYRGRRVVDVNWDAGPSRYLPQHGLCDDIAFDHAASRLAVVSESGQVDVYQWAPRDGAP